MNADSDQSWLNGMMFRNVAAERFYSDHGREIRWIDPSLPDRELVLRTLKGDDDYFSVLVERYLASVYAFSYSYLGNPDDASDAAQETFIKAWSHLKTFNPEKSLKTWLMTIAKNTALDALKKKRPALFSELQRNDADLDMFLAPYLASVEMPDEELIRQEDARVIIGALEKTPPSYRVVLNLRYGEGLPFGEIAEILEEPINTVKSKHRRGLLYLRKVLGREE